LEKEIGMNWNDERDKRIWKNRVLSKLKEMGTNLRQILATNLSAITQSDAALALTVVRSFFFFDLILEEKH